MPAKLRYVHTHIASSQSGYPIVDRDHLSRLLLQRIEASDTARRVVKALELATRGDIYLFGGCIRRVLVGNSRLGDLDFMVHNGDVRPFDFLRNAGASVEFTRQHHHRFHWNEHQIDLLQPCEFYKGFRNVVSALRYFDLRINALALHLASRHILDPLGVLRNDRLTDPGINWERWNEMPPTEIVVLAIRLARIMREAPELTISSSDATRLRSQIVPQIESIDWSEVHDRFPAGKDAFLKHFGLGVLAHTRLEDPVGHSPHLKEE